MFLSRFARLSGAERLVLFEALALAAGVRLGLTLLPLRTVRRWLRRLAAEGDRHRAKGGSLPVERIVWAVRAASRRVPGSTCLVQAMTGEVLLRRRGIPASVRIGVAKDGPAGFRAHAWLESDGMVLIGDDGDTVKKYEPLTVLEE